MKSSLMRAILLLVSAGASTASVQALQIVDLLNSGVTETGKRIGRDQQAGTTAGKRLPKVALRIYDFDQVDSNTMAEAREVASEIFRKAGLQVLWVECQLESRCASDADGPEFRLRIVSQSLAEQMVSDDSLGFALPCAIGDTTCLFYIFNWRIKAVANANYVEAGRLLGHVLAHELGHVLLGPNAHIRSGVMQHRLPVSETARILFFTSQQAKSIRANVVERASEVQAWDAR
jgi:hypothetical protein